MFLRFNIINQANNSIKNGIIDILNNNNNFSAVDNPYIKDFNKIPDPVVAVYYITFIKIIDKFKIRLKKKYTKKDYYVNIIKIHSYLIKLDPKTKNIEL